MENKDNFWIHFNVNSLQGAAETVLFFISETKSIIWLNFLAVFLCLSENHRVVHKKVSVQYFMAIEQLDSFEND